MKIKNIILFSVLIILCGCNNSRRYFSKDLQPLRVDILRFDSALLSVNTKQDSVYSSVCRLYSEFPYFMPVYCEQILGIDAEDTAFLAAALPEYLNDTLYGFSTTNQMVKKTFSDISDIHDELNIAFARLKYLYPDLIVPEITFFVSGFNASLFFWEPMTNISYQQTLDFPMQIAVGVDMYLGSDYEYYNRVVWNYQKQTMRKECIPADVVSAFLFRTIPFTSTESRLLENMIYRGKIMYLLSLLLPDQPKYEIMGYTQNQWNWAVKNEKNIWQMMIDKRDIWKSDSPILTSYLNDGPFTTEISQEAPPRLGTFIGWRIAESYMNNNENMTLLDLMSEGDARKILEMSYYKP